MLRHELTKKQGDKVDLGSATTRSLLDRVVLPVGLVFAMAAAGLLPCPLSVFDVDLAMVLLI
jgi:hypothetical protein